MRAPEPLQVVAALRAAGMTVATAESLTGGLLCAGLTAVPGASAVVRGGLIVYATDLKHSLAGVDTALLDRVGPVDPAVAAALAIGARRRCGADVGVGCTGVAGPDPQDGHPPGTWFVAVAGPQGERLEAHHAAAPGGPPPTRDRVRVDVVAAALQLLADLAGVSGVNRSDDVPGTSHPHAALDE